MARRMVLGNMPTGGIDFRISRPGIDAATGDINDRQQISFAMSRDVNGRVAAAGALYGIGVWVNFPEVFAAPPPVLWGTMMDGGMLIDEYNRVNGNSGRYHDGSPYALAVTSVGVCAICPADFTYWVPGTNQFIFMAVE